MSELDPALAEKRDRLLAILRSCGRVAVAYSGGVDSAVVAKAAQLACGDKAVAVTAVSASLASGEREAAEKLAAADRHSASRDRNATNSRIPTTSRTPPTAATSARPSCTRGSSNCSIGRSRAESSDLGLEFDVLVNGANLDDRGDYRPGMTGGSRARRPQPADRSRPHQGRRAATGRPLGTCPCGTSRPPPAFPAASRTDWRSRPSGSQRVDEAEKFLREEFGLREFRVRHEVGDLARIEVPLAELAAAHRIRPREAITQRLRASSASNSSRSTSTAFAPAA